MKLGRANVDAMLRGLTAVQFQEWVAYAELEPFDEMRADYRTASIVQMIANVNRDSKRHKDGFPITDFLLAFGDAKPAKQKPKSWQEMKLTAQMIAEVYK